MKNKIKYIEEIYTDKYRTLYQAILIDVDLDKKVMVYIVKVLERR